MYIYTTVSTVSLDTMPRFTDRMVRPGLLDRWHCDNNISINNDAPKDNRSYKVDFSLLEKLAPETIQVSLDQSIQGLIAGLSRMEFKDNEFRSSDLIRLNAIRKARQSIFFKN